MPRAKLKVPKEKPAIGLPDPLQAAQEEARNAKEGAHKLGRAVEALRVGLETVVMAQMDRQTGLPTTTADLRGIAVDALNAYSLICGQNWQRHRLIGNWAGDRSVGTEAAMRGEG